MDIENKRGAERPLSDDRPTCPGPDAALTDHLAESLAAAFPGLEQFLRFEGEDPATRRSAWLATLNEPLAREGHRPGADARAPA